MTCMTANTFAIAPPADDLTPLLAHAARRQITSPLEARP
jgi:hypothetical protein